MGPPHVPGHILGYPDARNSGSPGYTLYCRGEGFLVGRSPFAIRRGEGGEEREGEMVFQSLCPHPLHHLLTEGNLFSDQLKLPGYSGGLLSSPAKPGSPAIKR